MAKERVTVEVEQSREAALMRLGGSTARLGTSIVDEILAKLGVARTQMLPPHPDSAGHEGAILTAYPEIRWVVGGGALQGGTILSIRDPRFGWAHYHFPTAEVIRLADTLRRHASLPPETAPDRPN